MKAIETPLNDVVIVEAPVFTDERGWFTEVHHSAKFAAIGLPTEFLQDNHSRSSQHVLRGLHFQRKNPQGKLVRPVTGVIFDVAVDLRRSSSTFAQWFGITLSAGDGRQLWIPPGFAHGFLVLSESADVSYKCTTLYDHPSDASLAWNDPTVGITWPLDEMQAPLMSAKDLAAPLLANVVPFS